MLMQAELHVAISLWYKNLRAADKALVVEWLVGHPADEVELRLGLPSGAFEARLTELRCALSGQI